VLNAESTHVRLVGQPGWYATQVRRRLRDGHDACDRSAR
jgi:hypothetical protein